MQSSTVIVLLIAIVPCLCQRPFYAGLHPIGIPEVNAARSQDEMSLPAALNGDEAYANRLDQMPIDQQPFWYVNQKQYKDLMDHPKTYSLRPSGYNENSG